MPPSARPPPRARQSAGRFGRRAACPHAAVTGCIDRQSSVSRTRFRTRHARPYDVCGRRRCMQRGSASRADIKSAPTDPLRGCRRGGLYGCPRPGPNSRRGSMVPPAALTAPSQTTKNPADGSAGFGFKRGIRARPAPWPSGRRRRRPRCRHRRRSHRRRPG